MTELDDPLQTYTAQAQALAERARAAQEQLATLHPSVTSDDGAVTVTVTATGSLIDISFGPAAESLDLRTLASLIKRTAQAARIEGARGAQRTLAGLVGENSDALAFVRRQLPALEEQMPDLSTTGGAAVRPATATGGPPAPPMPDEDDDGFRGR